MAVYRGQQINEAALRWSHIRGPRCQPGQTLTFWSALMLAGATINKHHRGVQEKHADPARLTSGFPHNITRRDS